MTGEVFLVGAGPGDPGLLTLRGRDLLASADVVVYDRLVHPALLNYAREDAERIYVGKSSSHHVRTQEEINETLVARAQEGKRVVRLKGGDPFVFGRGGEEAEVCAAAGVPFSVTPGITSAIAAPAYAGIPVTHRDAASSFAVITGHERDDACERGAGAAETRRRWDRIAHAADTLVFLMGVETLSTTVERLVANGRDVATPVALVQWGTWPAQRVVVGTLADIVQRAAEANVRPPAVCVVGDVVALREKLAWFDSPARYPLFGKRVLVTRAREQASALSDLLRARGADPVEFPVIRIDRLSDYAEADASIAQLSRYAWIVFTSANGVSRFADRLESAGKDARALAHAKIATIGPSTALELKSRLAVRADFAPSEAVAERVIEEWPEPEMSGRAVLIPRAREARDLLPERLRDLGASVDVVPVYETRAETTNGPALQEEVEEGRIDIVTFTSSSTVRYFAQAVGDINAWRERTVFASIGPITSATARELGIELAIEAKEHTIPGLVAAIEEHYRL